MKRPNRWICDGCRNQYPMPAPGAIDAPWRCVYCLPAAVVAPQPSTRLTALIEASAAVWLAPYMVAK